MKPAGPPRGSTPRPSNGSTPRSPGGQALRAPRLGRALIAWAAILAFAMANGALREAVLVPRLGAPWAQIASGALLAACVAVVALATVRWIGATDLRSGATVGALWLATTLAFESGFGRLVLGRPWHELLAAYTFRDGNLWPLVLVVVATAPAIAARRVGPGRGDRGRRPEG